MHGTFVQNMKYRVSIGRTNFFVQVNASFQILMALILVFFSLNVAIVIKPRLWCKDIFICE